MLIWVLLSSNSIFSVIQAQNPELLGLKWKLRTWEIQKWSYMYVPIAPSKLELLASKRNRAFFWDTL